MAATWTRLSEGQQEECASASCGHAHASWRMEAGGVASYFCDDCRQKIDMPEQIYAERDPETNEKLWFSIRGMGVEYVKATPERRWSFDCEWYLGGVRMQPGEYVVVRVGAPVNADTPF